MAAITARIHPKLNSYLETVAEQTGIPKTSLILYALNDQLRRENFKISDLYLTRTDQPEIRFTLRMPDNLKLLLEHTAEKEKCSINFLVNLCIYNVHLLFWSAYNPTTPD